MYVEEIPGVFRVRLPAGPSVPILFESPHSGRDYPADFGACLPLERLRPAEDAYVDELLATAPDHGIAVVEALFPRAYIDPNRTLDDLDPALLAAPWPTPLRPGPKSALGIGLVRRVVTPDAPIYDRRLAVAEVEARIARYWRPYRERVAALVRGFAARHGRVLVVQWHSMKPVGDAATPDGPGAVRPDVVIGDRHGATAGAGQAARLAELFAARGLEVALNEPYAGTEILEHLAGLAPRVTALQVELSRALYLEPARVERTAGFVRLRDAVDSVAMVLGDAERGTPGA